MSTPKTKYVLGLDDLIRSEFFTQTNAERVLAGLNGSGSTKQLAVDVGGTGTKSADLVNLKILYYDSATKTIKSSGNNHDFTPEEIDLSDYALLSQFRGEGDGDFLQVNWDAVIARDAPRSRLVRAYRTADGDMIPLSRLSGTYPGDAVGSANPSAYPVVTFTHGLGVQPDIYFVDAVCVGTDALFNTGDVLRVGAHSVVSQYSNGGCRFGIGGATGTVSGPAHHDTFCDEQSIIFSCLAVVRSDGSTAYYDVEATPPMGPAVQVSSASVSSAILSLVTSTAHNLVVGDRFIVQATGASDVRVNTGFEVITAADSTHLTARFEPSFSPSNGTITFTTMRLRKNRDTSTYQVLNPSLWKLRGTAISVQPA